MKNRIIFVLCAVFFVQFQTVRAQSSEFTYQGRLTGGVVTANGSYDFEFRLFNVETEGDALGTVTREAIVVQDGIFTVKLDFRRSSFDGTNRWLEIRVKTNGSPNYTLLAPRQKITSVPHALRSSSAEIAVTADNATALGGLSAENYVLTTDARLSDARPPLAGSADYIQNSTEQQALTSFNISGNGFVGGILAGDVVSATTQFNLGQNRVLSVPGVANLFVGLGTGAANTNGRSNSFFGSNAGASNTEGSQNSFFGRGSGFRNTTGGDNSFFGEAAGLNNIEGSRNSFFGRNSGFNNTASDNSFFGSESGRATTGGAENSFFGFRAGVSNTAGAKNTFTGSHAGRDNTASFNSFYGANSGEQTTSGDLNSFFGTSSGQGNTNGSSNSFFGAVAGATNSTGIRNVYLGATAGRLATGSSNVMIGYNAGTNFTAGTENVFIGSEAGRSFTSGTGNIFIGARSANISNSQLGSGNDNIVIGTAFGGLGNYSNSIAIGSFIFGSNEITIGSGGQATKFFGDVNIQGKIGFSQIGSGGTTQICWQPQANVQPLSFCSSSLRYKKNVNDFKVGLDLIRRLRPVTFNWKSNDQADLGLIAEEVAAVEPLLATYNSTGEVEGVKYDRVGVILINAVREQSAQIEAQARQIGEQNEIIKKQQREIDALKRFVCAQNPTAEICQPVD